MMTATDNGFAPAYRDELEPLAGPRRSYDPWVVSCGWIDGWVLDMCDRRTPPDDGLDTSHPSATARTGRWLGWRRRGLRASADPAAARDVDTAGCAEIDGAIGEPGGTRTHDQGLKRPLLYRLSYRLTNFGAFARRGRTL